MRQVKNYTQIWLTIIGIVAFILIIASLEYTIDKWLLGLGYLLLIIAFLLILKLNKSKKDS
jgi:general stress protein CsbA